MPDDLNREHDAGEYEFEVTHGEDRTELLATDLESLLKESSEGLELKPDSFNITYMSKGKPVLVKSQNAFRMMIKKHANEDGVYSVQCVPKENNEEELEIEQRYSDGTWQFELSEA